MFAALITVWLQVRVLPGPPIKSGISCTVGSEPLTNRLRYDANLLVSLSSGDQSIAIKGARLSVRYPFDGRSWAPVLLSCPPIRMLVFLGSHPLQLAAKSLLLHSHCMDSAHQNRLHAYDELHSLHSGNWPESPISLHLAMKTPRTTRVQAKLKSALAVRAALIKAGAGKS
jgi:hypothetical protein